MAGDKLVAESNARLMIHDAIGVAVGNSKDMLDLAKLLDAFSDDIAQIYADRAGGTTAQWRDRMRAETWYSAQEAKAAGLVDEVIGRASKATRTPTARWDLSLFQYRQPLEPAAKAEPVAPTEPADEAGFSMPPLDLGRIRDAVESIDDLPIAPGLIAAAVSLAVNDVPAPDPAPPPAPASPELEVSVNLPDLRRVLRRATK
jgi:hypothetical protein